MRHYFSHDRIYNPSPQRFLFATGIECSAPLIQSPEGRPRRIDQLEKCDHYRRWSDDFDAVVALGIRHLRYGLPWHRVHVGPGRYDWSFADEVMPAMQSRGIVPILDLCHFGAPDWLGNFQNPELPRFFSEYARAVAERYPWVRCYTPVNEMYICAEFSAYFGWWNERLASHAAFVTALKHLARACVDGALAILTVRPDALFVLCESSETTHARKPDLVDEAELFNERRFLSLDLVCARRVSSGMFAYLLDAGMTEAEYESFLCERLSEHYVIGHDYYAANERLVDEYSVRTMAGDVLGYYPIARQYAHRYHIPVMHTETNTPVDGVNWLWKTWANIQQLRHDGIPVIGMTWYSLTHQVDWDVALREERNQVYPVGLYDLDRRMTAVGEQYRQLIALWRETPLMPSGPLTLDAAGDDFAPRRP